MSSWSRWHVCVLLSWSLTRALGTMHFFSDRQNTACYCLALLAILSDYLQTLSSVLWLIFWLVWVVWDFLEPRSNVYFLFDVSDDSAEGILERSMTTGCTPIPKIAIQEEKEDFIRKEFGKASRTRELFWLFSFWYSFSVFSWLILSRSCGLEVGTLCLCG